MLIDFFFRQENFVGLEEIFERQFLGGISPDFFKHIKNLKQQFREVFETVT